MQVGVPEMVKLYRVVVGCVMASLLWKYRDFPAMYLVYSNQQLTDSFFPASLANPKVLAALYFVPLISGLLAMFIKQQVALVIQSTIASACLLGMCQHQGSYNDVTFLTCLWASLWTLWLALKLDTPATNLLPLARTFAMLVVSLFFLGGAVGKWTPGYWSGQVLYDIYFVDRDYWFFNLLRSRLDAEPLREFATAYSRLVIIIESACAGLWLLPPRFSGAIGGAVLCGIALLSNVLLFSVMFALLGLCLVAMHESPEHSFSGRARSLHENC